MGLVPTKALGIEWYGKVTRVGSSATKFHEGEQVIGVFPTNFGNRIQVSESSVESFEKLPAGTDPVVSSHVKLYAFS